MSPAMNVMRAERAPYPWRAMVYATTFPGVPDCTSNKKARAKRAFPICTVATDLPQITAEALDALAGVFEVRGLGCIGDAECRAEAEGRSLHHRDAFGFQQFCDEVLVVLDHLARRRSLADGAGAGRVDIERTFRTRTIDARSLIEHRHNEIAALLEHGVVLGDEI